MSKGNYRSGSVCQLRSVLRGIMRTAVLDGNALKDPVKTRIPKSSVFEAVILQRSDLAAFHKETAQSRYYGAIEFQYATGVRISELIGLTWDEIDFERGDIHIDHQYQNGCLCDTKNKKRRTLKKHIHGRLLNILLEEKERYDTMKAIDPFWNPLDLVFAGKHGKALTYSKLEQEITEIGKRIGLDHFTSHSLRHTYASHRAAVTGDLDLVQRELGHEHLVTTLNYICQLDENVELHNQKMDYYWDSL